MIIKRVTLSLLKMRKNCMCSQVQPKGRMEETSWTPVQLIEPSEHKQLDYAVLVLNARITVPVSITHSLWQNAKFRVLVDGGANRWLSYLHDHSAEPMKDPDLISGDFDSVSPKALEVFRKTNAKIVHTPDQDETDFTKAVKLLEPIIKERNLTSIIVIQENGGRLDQIMANINTLYKTAKLLANVNLYLIGGSSLTWLLKPGQHSIQIPSYLVESERWCSLIPIGKKSTVTTKGLKWNLDNGILEFGELVSTSNTYASQSLEITTDTCLLWSMGVFSFD